jgi:hypothetical protein
MSENCHEPTYAPQQTTELSDYLVGAGEQCWRHGKTQRLAVLTIMISSNLVGAIEFVPELNWG